MNIKNLLGMNKYLLVIELNEFSPPDVEHYNDTADPGLPLLSPPVPQVSMNSPWMFIFLHFFFKKLVNACISLKDSFFLCSKVKIDDNWTLLIFDLKIFSTKRLASESERSFPSKRLLKILLALPKTNY